MSVFYLKIAGVTHDNRQAVVRNLRPGQKLIISAEPNNPYDSNAVHVRTMDGRDVGFIPRENNSQISYNLRNNIGKYDVSVEALTGGNDGLAYGCNIKITFTDNNFEKAIKKKGFAFIDDDGYLSEESKRKYESYDSMAQEFDKEGDKESLLKAVEYYKKAAKGHIAHAEYRLGNIFAKNDWMFNGNTFEAHRQALAYYSMAVEDSNDPYAFLLGSTLAYDESLGPLQKPHELAQKAFDGDEYARMALSVYYWRVGKLPERALETLREGARRGSLLCYYNIADELFTMDDEQYKATPRNYQRFYQPSSWIDIASEEFGSSLDYRIFSEQLIVHSSDAMVKVFKILEDILRFHKNERLSGKGDTVSAFEMVRDLYVKIINESNSYKRGIDHD